MHKTLRIVVFLLCSLFFISEACAQTLAGGEVYYELIGAKKYKVTAHLYRMCESVALNGITANVYGDTVVRAMHFKRIAIAKINDTCNNPCNKQNTASNPGFEKHTYIDTIDFNVAPYDVFVSKQICVVNFGIRMAARYANPTTHDTGQFYIDAATNICLSHITKNTSPQFSMEPKFKAGCNYSFFYSPGPLDSTDNDSFVFSLVDIQSNYKSKIAYMGSFSSQIPMSPFCVVPGLKTCRPIPGAPPSRGFYFDKMGCNTIFTPTDCNEKGTIKYQIDEYRFNKQIQKHEWIGYITREMLIQIYSSGSNLPPRFNGSYLSEYEVCEGNKLCFRKKLQDSNLKDTITLNWDNGTKNAYAKIIDTTAREKELEFCLQTVKSKNRTENQYFTIGAYDKKCNSNLVSLTSVIITKPFPVVKYYNEVKSCGKIKWNSNVYDSLYPNNHAYSRTWLIDYKNNNVIEIKDGLIDSTILHFNGKVIIQHSYYSNTSFNICTVTVRDTINISNAVELPNINNNKDSIICPNTLARFQTNPSKITNFQNLKWYINDSLINSLDSIIQYAFLKPSKIKIQIQNIQGCTLEKTINYNILQHKALLNTDSAYCMGEIIKIQANYANLRRPLTYKWSINNIDTNISDSAFKIVIDKNKKVKLSIANADQCVFTDSVLSNLYIDPKLKLNGVNELCRDSIYTASANQVNTNKKFTYQWKLNGIDTFNNDSIFHFIARKDSKITLKILYQAGCSITDSISFKTVPTPRVNLSFAPYQCMGSTYKLKPKVSNSSPNMIYEWSENSTWLSKDSTYSKVYNSNTVLKLKVSNILGCSTEDTAKVFVYNNGPLLIQHVSQYHPSTRIVLKLNKSFAQYRWFDGETASFTTFWVNTLGAPGNYKLWCTGKDLNNCVYSDTIQINTNAFLKNENVSDNTFKVYPNPVVSELNVESDAFAIVELYTVDGRLVYQSNMHVSHFAIDMQHYVAGLYLLKVKMNDYERTFKIIKD
jgi:hypothetical protein